MGALEAVAGQPGGVDAVGLGASSMRGDEGFHLGGVGAAAGQAQLHGRFQQLALVAAGGLADQPVIVGIGV